MTLLGRTVGRYKVISELGRGQHSVVYKAWQPSLERYVALKVLEHYEQQTLLKFQAEAHLTAQLIQQGIANIREIYEVGQTKDGYLFVALEFVEDSLYNLLRRNRGRRQLMNPAAAATFLLPIGQALDAIHRLGWVHLDLKPQNILISREGRALLADFGIAQRIGSQTHACTPYYASPEQAAGDRSVGPWSDVYSLGVVLYEMVSGHPPVRGDQDIVLLTQHLEIMPPPPSRVNQQITSNQERAIFKALAKPPQQRFQTAGDFLQAMLASEPLLTSVLRTPSRMLSTLSGRVPPLALLGGILVIVVIVLLAIAVLWPKANAGPAQPTATATAQLVLTPESTPTSQPTTNPTATRVPTATLAPTRTPAPGSELSPGTPGYANREVETW